MEQEERGRRHKGVGQFPKMTFLEGNHCTMQVILLIRCTCMY
jgi:ribosomal protein L44E